MFDIDANLLLANRVHKDVLEQDLQYYQISKISAAVCNISLCLAVVWQLCFTFVLLCLKFVRFTHSYFWGSWVPRSVSSVDTTLNGVSIMIIAWVTEDDFWGIHYFLDHPSTKCWQWCLRIVGCVASKSILANLWEREGRESGKLCQFFWLWKVTLLI